MKIVKEAKTAVSQTLEQTQSCVNKHAGPFHNTFPRVMRWKNCSNAAAQENPSFRPAVVQLIRTTKTNTASDPLFSWLNVLLYFAADCIWCKIRRPHKGGRMTKIWGIFYHKYSVSVYFVYFCIDNKNSSKESLRETYSSAVPEQISVLEWIGRVNDSMVRLQWQSLVLFLNESFWIKKSVE